MNSNFLRVTRFMQDQKLWVNVANVAMIEEGPTGEGVIHFVGEQVGLSTQEPAASLIAELDSMLSRGAATAVARAR